MDLAGEQTRHLLKDTGRPIFGPPTPQQEAPQQARTRTYRDLSRMRELYGLDAHYSTADSRRLFAAWKPRIKDDWVFMFPVDRDPDSTSVSRATCDTRVTAACNIALKTASQRLKALDIVTFEIDPRTSYADYIEAGIDPAVLLQEEKFAPWRMVLGPGTAIRVSPTG